MNRTEWDVEALADFIRDKIESEPYQGLHPELASMGLAVAIRDEFLLPLPACDCVCARHP